MDSKGYVILDEFVDIVSFVVMIKREMFYQI